MIHGGVLERFLGKYYTVPFLCMLIDNQFVVSSILNDSAAAVIRIRKGDVIKEVNGEDVFRRFKRLKPYVISSNIDNKAMTFAASFLFRGTDSLFAVKKERHNKVIFDTIQLSQQTLVEVVPGDAWKILKDSIGYVDMGALKKEQVHDMMQELMPTKGIIFDIRNYPNNTWSVIVNFLSKKPFIMSKVTYPDLDYPGLFLYHKPIIYGKENKESYTGKVVLLVNESSVSHAEYSAMGLQAACSAVTIGNTTAGKDGDINNRFWLPGGYISRFSGLGIYYPDGTVTQRKGIKIDIKARPSIRGLQEGRDELIERALTYFHSINKTPAGN